MARREYERFPRPRESYYEIRFPFLSQGDIFDSIPIPLMGADLLRHDAMPGMILQQVGVQRVMIVSPTCDFRRPSASSIEAHPEVSPYTFKTT